MTLVLHNPPHHLKTGVYTIESILGQNRFFRYVCLTEIRAVFDGVRFQFGQKSSEYDRFNYINTDGTITDTLKAGGKSLMGGTVIPLSAQDGAIKNPYIYYCGYPQGAIDWSQWM